jgi:hypothetical protein
LNLASPAVSLLAGKYPNPFSQQQYERSPESLSCTSRSFQALNGEVGSVRPSVINPSNHAIELMPPQVQLGGKFKKKWTTAEQLSVTDYRLSTRRLGAGARADGVVVFERPAFKQANETLFLQMAESGAVDKPALAPVGFGISTFRGGSAYGAGENNSHQ